MPSKDSVVMADHPTPQDRELYRGLANLAARQMARRRRADGSDPDDEQKADRDRWHAARTMADLGSATADWLERRLPSLTGYEPGAGPDEETTDLVPILAALNRAGFVTTSSQPGCADDGDGWRQRAAVSGFVTARMMDRVQQLWKQMAESLNLAPAYPARTPAGRWIEASTDTVAVSQPSFPGGIVVTTHHDKTVTMFGRRLTRDDIAEIYPDCPSAWEAVAHATQLTVFDPEWGRNTLLWKVLEQLAG